MNCEQPSCSNPNPGCTKQGCPCANLSPTRKLIVALVVLALAMAICVVGAPKRGERGNRKNPTAASRDEVKKSFNETREASSSDGPALGSYFDQLRSEQDASESNQDDTVSQ